MNAQNLRHNALAILACLLWSSAFVTGKQALEHQTPLNLAASRFILAGLLQIPLSGGLKAPFKMLREHFPTVLLVSLFHTVYLYSTFFIALRWVQGAEGAIMVGMGPLASALMAHFLTRDDKMRWKTMTGILLGISGVVLISLATKPWSPVGPKEFCGLMLLLSGSVVSAIGNVVVAKRKGGLHPIALNCSQMLLGGVILLFLGFQFEGAMQFNLPPRYYATLLWLASVSATAFAIWFHLLSKIKVSKLNLWKFIIPLSGATLSWSILAEESPTPISLIGMALIAGGIIVGQVERKKSQPTKQETAAQ